MGGTGVDDPNGVASSSTAVAGGVRNDIDDVKNDDERDDDVLLLSRIVPPSHILSDGRFVRLPPPSSSERSLFFERAVASNRLIDVDGSAEGGGGNGGVGSGGSRGGKKRTRGDESGTTADGNGGKRRKDASCATSSSSIVDTNKGGGGGGGKTKSSSSKSTLVHPLAIASARLRAKGIDELSKAINLGGLVMGGEYFGLANVVAFDGVSSSGGSGGAVATKGGKMDGTSTSSEGVGVGVGVGDGGGKHNDASSSSSTNANPSNIASSSAETTMDATTTNTNATDEASAIDSRHRSAYVLRRRKSQYDSASSTLSRHVRRLSLSISSTRVLDARYRELRRRWKLDAPEHGTSASAGPVRPYEAVAVDVEVYNKNRRRRIGTGGTVTGRTLGRIAGRIPRFATLELDDDHDISGEVRSLRLKIKHVIDRLERGKGGPVDDASTTPTDGMEDDGIEKADALSNTAACKTKAEPFTMTDLTIGRFDRDSDPNKVPLLTLLFMIEKPSTGFFERATLSSSFLSLSTNDVELTIGLDDSRGGGGRQLNPDERVIEALQHSLFCASFFESIRAEVIPVASSAQSNSVGATPYVQHRQTSVAWLSSEMEESFLPPPSVMAGEDTRRAGDAQMLCVIYCHEGELKVQLNDEYSLTVKLIEAGVNNHLDAGTAATTTNYQDKCSDTGMGGSGSLSPIQLRTLCRALLLHSQSLYHDHCMNIPRGSPFHSAAKVENKPLDGFARMTKETKPSSPHILQSCIGLGCKSIIEKKVQAMLKRLSRWLEHDMKCKDKIVVDWLSLAFFTPHSRFVLLFREICLDVAIHGDALRLTHTCASGFRAVGFGSEVELECFLKLEFRRTLDNHCN